MAALSIKLSFSEQEKENINYTPRVFFIAILFLTLF